ncbi:MAG: hypothetical protein JW750_03570 [Anaerolineaceae bacterium]|nr:hypothetical protein [Anaerolineaceae bacterium]
MSTEKQIQNIIASRSELISGLKLNPNRRQEEAAEGGCGVVGMAANFPVAGRHFFNAAEQMHNRGNGKGGGIAASGLNPAQMGVSPEVLRDSTLLQVAYIDPDSRDEVEQGCIFSNYDVLHSSLIETIDDYREIPGLDVRPPDVVRYFVRAKAEKLAAFAGQFNLADLEPRKLEDEFVYRCTFDLNTKYYASLGEQRAFVLSHGRDLLVFKIVGYAEQAAKYYKLEDMEAHVWIAHQRYPTKGRVWHPGGAHPFIGLNEALVHNGDFANYHAVASYLRQRNIVPLFLTDTEVGALMFDLLDRTYEYPLEATIEALAPTTERDFMKLPAEKQALYHAIQSTHIHASPDGPWFFIIARSKPDQAMHQLLGITDTSMLRPQVFALMESEYEGKNYQIGLIGSEKQAIDATLASLNDENPGICRVADRYWNARGGSYNDGGSFSFTVTKTDASAPYGEGCVMRCENKFGEVINAPQDQHHYAVRHWEYPDRDEDHVAGELIDRLIEGTRPISGLIERTVDAHFAEIADLMRETTFEELEALFSGWVSRVHAQPSDRLAVVGLFTRLRDRICDTGSKRRASVLAMIDRSLNQIFDEVPLYDPEKKQFWARFDVDHREDLGEPALSNAVLVLDVSRFPAEGDDGPGMFLARAVSLGWQHLISYRWRGQRFLACSLGPNHDKVRFDAYGSPGDYLASGLDGEQISVHVHNNAQDQVSQIFNAGRLVVNGDTGQTFMYGAKGGEAYIRGNAAGRPLINAVGHPRVVINGTCLDYLAESFMAGDPLNGGGFVILNGIEFDDHGKMRSLPEPYPGGNLFSLASGGAIYIRDPFQLVSEDQLNGGHFSPLTGADEELILPYLRRNEDLFGIRIDDLLKVNGEKKALSEVYRKVGAVKLEALE